MDSPIIVAILVFLSVYVIWFLIRLLADFILVGIALGSATLAFYIKPLYPEFRDILTDSSLLNLLGLTLPKQPSNLAIYFIAALIVIVAVLISIPFLPFSKTYRLMFGVENPVVFRRKEAKVRGWIVEEIKRYHQQSEKELKITSENENNLKNSISSKNGISEQEDEA